MSEKDGRRAELQDLLLKTSRTFALAIPLLPDPTVREVTIAYLLFRIADTFEDASVLWSRERRIEGLSEFAELLSRPSVEEADRLADRWLEDPPTDHAGYAELLEKTPVVFEAFLELSQDAQRAIAEHTIRTSHGMASVVQRTGDDGLIELTTVRHLQDYCYFVAGIVGEMLTELFLLGSEKLDPVRGYLRERAASFGEALQLVNILRDSASDATEGRYFLPPGIPRDEVFALARLDLEAAAEYTLAVQRAGGPDGVVLFTGLPLELAWATLDRVEEAGPGAKLTRPEVYRIHSRLHRALAEGLPAISRSTASWNQP